MSSRTPLIVLVCVAGISGIAPAQQLQDRDIQDAWRSRQERVRTLRAEVHVTKFHPARSHTAVESGEQYPPSAVTLEMDYSLLLEGQTKFRLSREGREFELGTGTVIERGYDNGWLDGVERTLFNRIKGRNGSYPVGFIGESPSDWGNINVMPLLLHFIADNPHFNPVAKHEYAVSEKRVVVDGKSCLEYRPVEDDGGAGLVYYVCPEMDMAVLRVDKIWNQNLLWRLTTKFTPHPTIEWVPQSFEYKMFLAGRVNTRAVAEIEELVLNQPVERPGFFVEFPPDTLVSSRLNGERELYLLRANGEKRIITEAERRHGLDYERYKVTETGEAVDGPRG